MPKQTGFHQDYITETVEDSFNYLKIPWK